MSDKKNGMVIRVVCTLVVLLWGALTTVTVFTGDTVRANFNKATDEHTAIRKEVKDGDDKVRIELMKEMALLRTEQKDMRKESNDNFIEVLKLLKK